MYSTKITFASACFLFFSFLNWRCTKIDTTDIGAGLLPAVDNVKTFDTVLTVLANNVDSVSSDCIKVYPADDHVLGYISNDPLFGTTKASIFTELKPSSFPYSFAAVKDSLYLDSVILVLSYKRSYGDTTIPQKVNVYETSQPLTTDSSTTSCSNFNINMSLLGSAIYKTKDLTDSFKGSLGESSKNQLRIKLDNSLGLRLLSADSSTKYKNDSTFRTFFNGFAIVPDSNFGGNALNYFNLADTNTKLSLYYRYKKNGAEDTTVNNFRLTSLSYTANNILRNHSGAEITLHTIPPPGGDNAVYIQTTPGTFAELRVEGLGALDNRIVHRAELIMDQVYSPLTNNDYFTVPNILYLQIKNSDSSYKPIPCDFNFLTGQPNFDVFGGLPKAAKDASGNSISRYTFNITRYVQKIVTNDSANYTFKLSAPDYITNFSTYIDECNQGVSPFNYGLNILTIGRIKLAGGDNINPLTGMRLRIIYSKL